MKITAKQFALSLYDAADGKTPVQVKAVIEKFVLLLAKKSQLAKAEKIIAEFLKIWNEKHGITEAKVLSAKKLSRETVKQLKDYIKKLSKANEVTMEEGVDENILGGVIIRYGDRILDGSLKTSLAELKNKMVK